MEQEAVSWNLYGHTLVLWLPRRCSEAELLKATCDVVASPGFRDIRGILVEVPQGCRRLAMPAARLPLQGHLAGIRAQLGDLPVAVVSSFIAETSRASYLRRQLSVLGTKIRLLPNRSEAFAWLATRN